jgi:hypothetical protein
MEQSNRKCKCLRSEGQLHLPGCEVLAEDYANAIRARGVFRARNSGVVDDTGRPIDESPLFQSVAAIVGIILHGHLQRIEYQEW